MSFFWVRETCDEFTAIPLIARGDFHVLSDFRLCLASDVHQTRLGALGFLGALQLLCLSISMSRMPELGKVMWRSESSQNSVTILLMDASLWSWTSCHDYKFVTTTTQCHTRMSNVEPSPYGLISGCMVMDAPCNQQTNVALH